MAQAISVRLDDEAFHALGQLEAAGMTRSKRSGRHWLRLRRDAAIDRRWLRKLPLSKPMTMTGPRWRQWPTSWRASVRRGDIFDLRLPEGVGHEQRGKRFGVVVQSDAFLPRSAVLVAPTSVSAKAASFRPQIEIDGSSNRVLVEQVGAVDINRLGDLAGHLTPEEQWGIDTALLTVLGLT